MIDGKHGGPKKGNPYPYDVKFTYIRKRLSAVCNITHMRFLPGVCARMDGQCGTLDEALVAVWEIAAIRPFVGMYPKMPAEV